MKIERDKFLTKAILGGNSVLYNPDFSTWKGFGILWEWAIKQEWFKKLFCYGLLIQTEFINPDEFSDTIYEFLKQKKIDNAEKLI